MGRRSLVILHHQGQLTAPHLLPVPKVLKIDCLEFPTPSTWRKMQPIHIPDDGGKKVNILGIPMVIRIHGRDTGGVVSAVESYDVPGGGPPPHIHRREDETFQVLEGEYEFIVDGKSFVARKGATIFAPRGIPHTYRYLGQAPGRLMCVITPAGFEGFFEAIGALTPDQQQDIPRVMTVAKQFGLEILPPPKN
jgi:quercetin dioxygenase-like cupin family protein